MHSRKRIRLSALPALYVISREPSLAPTTVSEISDADLGLTTDPVAQTRAENFIRAALAYRLRQSERLESPRRTLKPIMVRIDTIVDEQPDSAILEPVRERSERVEWPVWQ
jgi:hypothetical protein